MMDYENWGPVGYDPGISEEAWMDLLNNYSIFDDNSLIVMKCLLDYDSKEACGTASCIQLAAEYGRDFRFYNAVSKGLAKRVLDKTGCPEPPLTGQYKNEKYWPILFFGKPTQKKEDGHFFWRLRPELKRALVRMIVKDVSLFAP